MLVISIDVKDLTSTFSNVFSYTCMKLEDSENVQFCVNFFDDVSLITACDNRSKKAILYT